MAVSAAPSPLPTARYAPATEPWLTRDDLAAVIPAHNESQSLRSVVLACLEQVSCVIVVDDASTDGTLATIEDLPAVRLRSEVHIGKGGALALGFRAALERGALGVVTLDADGQHDAKDILAFLAAANRHPKAVIVGARLIERSRAPLLRRFANRVADYWISRAAGIEIRDSQCGQRLYPREVLAPLAIAAKPEEGFVFESEVLIDSAWRGFDVVSLPIASRYPTGARRSYFRPARDIWRITYMVSSRTFSGSRPMFTRVLRRAG